MLIQNEKCLRKEKLSKFLCLSFLFGLHFWLDNSQSTSLPAQRSVHLEEESIWT